MELLEQISWTFESSTICECIEMLTLEELQSTHTSMLELLWNKVVTHNDPQCIRLLLTKFPDIVYSFELKYTNKLSGKSAIVNPLWVAVQRNSKHMIEIFKHAEQMDKNKFKRDYNLAIEWIMGHGTIVFPGLKLALCLPYDRDHLDAKSIIGRRDVWNSRIFEEYI